LTLNLATEGGALQVEEPGRPLNVGQLLGRLVFVPAKLLS